MICPQEDVEEIVKQVYSSTGLQVLARIALMEQLLMRLPRLAKLALKDAEHALTIEPAEELNAQVVTQIW